MLTLSQSYKKRLEGQDSEGGYIHYKIKSSNKCVFASKNSECVCQQKVGDNLSKKKKKKIGLYLVK